MCTGARGTRCLRSPVTCPDSFPRHLKLPTTPRSGVTRETTGPLGKCSHPVPKSGAPHSHSFTQSHSPCTARQQRRPAPLPRAPSLATLPGTACSVVPQDLGAQTRCVPSSAQLAPPGQGDIAGSAGGRRGSNTAGASSRPQPGTRRVALLPSPAHPTFTLAIAVGVTPEEILHIRHCRSRMLQPRLGAASRLALRHGTNETRPCRKDRL